MTGDVARPLRAVPVGTPAPQAMPEGDEPSTAPTDAEVITALRREIQGLHEALESRAGIEQAKGMVMVCYGLSADQAFQMLARWSSLWNIKMRVVAATLARVGTQGPLNDDASSVLSRELASELQPPQ